MPTWSTVMAEITSPRGRAIIGGLGSLFVANEFGLITDLLSFCAVGVLGAVAGGNFGRLGQFRRDNPAVPWVAGLGLIAYSVLNHHNALDRAPNPDVVALLAAMGVAVYLLNRTGRLTVSRALISAAALAGAYLAVETSLLPAELFQNVRPSEFWRVGAELTTGAVGAGVAAALIAYRKFAIIAGAAAIGGIVYLTDLAGFGNDATNTFRTGINSIVNKGVEAVAKRVHRAAATTACQFPLETASQPKTPCLAVAATSGNDSPIAYVPDSAGKYRNTTHVPVGVGTQVEFMSAANSSTGLAAVHVPSEPKGEKNFMEFRFLRPMAADAN